MKLVNHLLNSVALSRRRWYASHRSARKQLVRPVISVGNLSVGGTGKTPITMSIARQLIEIGHRPAILSRGYKRQRSREGVVVVGDGTSVRSDVRHAGDEPYMMARSIAGAAVLVCSDRYLAGRLAETQFDCTVHVLDDGFQHFKLARDVDLLIVTERDIARPHTLPFGRLREPLAAAAAADAVLVASNEPVESDRIAGAFEMDRVFRFERTIDPPRLVQGHGGNSVQVGIPVSPPGPVFAVAAIANPHRFFQDLIEAGWELAGQRAFRDHHYFSRRELNGIARDAEARGAKAVLTTEKDMVRLEDLLAAAAAGTIPFCWVPLRVALEPAFGPWLQQRLAEARK